MIPAACKQVLTSIAGLAVALAFGSTALATEPVEFTNETLNEHCDREAETCRLVVHSTQETLVVAHVFGFEVDQSRCDEEFAVVIGENGSGHIVDQVLTQPPGQTCGKENCDGAEAEWPSQIEDDGAGNYRMEYTFCLQNLDNTGARHCTIEVDIDFITHHTAELSTTDQECDEGLGEVTGHWTTEPQDSDQIEPGPTEPDEPHSAAEFTLEGAGHCDIGLQNCKLVAHSVTDTVFVSHSLGVESTVFSCDDEWTAYLGETGDGQVVSQAFVGGTCGRESCTGDEGEWPFQIEESRPDDLSVEMQLCTRPAGGGSAIHCTIDLEADFSDHHTLEIRADDAPCQGNAREVSGHWVTEPAESDEIEVAHL